MTAINDLVDKAGSLGIGVSLQALYDMARTLEDMLDLEVFRVEFRIPAEPMEANDMPETVSVSQVDVYALAREIEETLQSLIIPEVAPMAHTAIPQKAAPSFITSVHTATKELRERVERLEKETISLPVIYSSFYASEALPVALDRSFAGDHAYAGDYTRAIAPGPPSIEAAPKEPEARPAIETRVIEKQAARDVLEKTVKKSSIESMEQSVRRSTTAVRELEDVYERLATSNIDVDKEIKRSTIVELDNVRATAFMGQPESAEAPQQEKGTAFGEMAASAPIVSGRSVEVPAFRLKLKVSPPSEQAADNVRRLSEAVAQSVSGPPPASFERERQVAVPREMAIAPPALVSVHRSLNIMNEYLSSAAVISGLAGLATAGVSDSQALGSQVLGGQAPLVQLMLDKAAAPASAPINMLVQAGESIKIPVPQPILIEGGSGSGPALNLAVSVVATRAMERSGGQAMLDLVRSADSGSLPVGREAVNVTMHGTGPDITENNTTNKVSNFHNTFNITVTVKGGSEDGDLRELGKKIGRILSEEIKRYGGI